MFPDVLIVKRTLHSRIGDTKCLRLSSVMAADRLPLINANHFNILAM